MNSKKVSVIIPIYNVEKYLNKCISSVVNQTYKNLQIILVDDGSPDNCPTMCDEWAKKDNRIQVIHQKNQGLSAARNAGLRIAAGEYVSFIDSDDWISINMVEIMLNNFDKFKADMVICQFAKVFSDGRIKANTLFNKSPLVMNAFQTMDLFIDDSQLTSHVWRKMYRCSLVPKAPFPVGKNFEDIYSMPDLVYRCKKIVAINDILYFYRQNDEGINKKLNKKNILDYFDAINHTDLLIKKYYPQLEYNKKLKNISYYYTVLDDMNNFHIDYPKIYKQIQKKVNLNISYLKTIYKKKDIRVIQDVEFAILSKLKLDYKSFRIYKKLFSLQKTIGKKLLVNKKIKISNSNKSRIFIIGAPDSGNLGDQELKFGEIAFIKKYFSDYNIELIQCDKVSDINSIKKCIKTSDITSFQAGGNIGTLYPGIHELQEKAIYTLKNKNLFIFPQTFFYSNDINGENTLNKTREVYNSCKNLQVFVRDKNSLDFVKNKLPKTKVALEPDMALMLSYKTTDVRNGALALLRIDSEGTLDWKDDDFIYRTLESKFDRVTQSDMHLYYDGLSEQEGLDKVKEKLHQVATSKVVITDRLHGMLFAAITDTPCVAVKSKSYKIQGVYDAWLKENAFIKLIDDVNELPKAIDEVMSVKNPKLKRDKINKEFDDMAELMKKDINDGITN